MTQYLGDFVEDDIVYVMFNTFTSDDPSASCTITNFVNTDVHIHKDDAVAQRNNAAGITVSVNFDGITGSHLIKIDTNDNTVAGFWVAGHDYFVRIEGTTIDGATINAVVAHFSIENRFMRGTDSAALATTALSNVTWTDAKAAFLDHSISTLDGVADGIQTDLSNATDGLGALKTLIDAVDSKVVISDTVVDGIQTDLSNATDGLGALKTLIDTIDGIVDNILLDTNALDVLSESGGSGDLTAIKTQVDAILDLTRDSGTVSVTSAETTLFEDAAPGKNKAGVVVKIDMAALQAGDTFVVKEKYKDESGGAYQEIDSVTYTGAQTKPLRIIALTPYRYGAIITMQKTAGTDRSIEWESFVGE